MQALTVSVRHIILVIKTRSTAYLRAPLLPFLPSSLLSPFAPLQPCLGLYAVSLNSRTVNAAAFLSTDTLLSRLKIRHGVNFIPARTPPFIFLYVQLKGCFWQMRSGKRSCLLSASSLHSPLLHSHPSAIKQHSPARSQTESKTKQPHSPHFHSAEMGRARVAQDLQVGQAEINRVNKEYPVQAEKG